MHNYADGSYLRIDNSEVWRLHSGGCILSRAGRSIKLTTAEYKILFVFVSGAQRVISRDDLIRALGKDPGSYTGLEMSLSRLQQKFCSMWDGFRLVRAVRNRGYCLVQKIHLVQDPRAVFNNPNCTVSDVRHSY